MLDVIASATTRAADVVDPRPAAVIEAIAETRRTIARLQAAEMMLLAAAYELGVAQISPSAVSGDPDRDLPLRSMAAQIGAATRTPDRTVSARMADAACVSIRFPHTFAALASGDITAAHLRAIVDAGAHLTAADALAAYEADAVAVAQRETPGRTRPAVRRLADHHEPRTLTERHRTARECWEVTVRDADDGMAILSALLPAPLAHAAYDRLTTIAADVRDAADATDSRTRAQTRADVLADLLLTGHATAHTSNASSPVSGTIRAHVQVVIPASTLVGGDLPASLGSGSSVDAATARRLAATATGWDRLFTHPTTGAVLAVDRYRPTDAQKRALAARDSHCRFPGCRVPTRRCDIDHTVARQHDGPTALTNLAHLCRRHHTLKHHTAWRVIQHADGTLHWTTPSGRRHVDTPSRTLTFTSEQPPDLPDPSRSHLDPPPF